MVSSFSGKMNLHTQHLAGGSGRLRRQKNVRLPVAVALLVAAEETMCFKYSCNSQTLCSRTFGKSAPRDAGRDGTAVAVAGMPEIAGRTGVPGSEPVQLGQKVTPLAAPRRSCQSGPMNFPPPPPPLSATARGRCPRCPPGGEHRHEENPRENANGSRRERS